MTTPDFSFLTKKKDEKPTKSPVDFSFLAPKDTTEPVPHDSNDESWGIGNIFSYIHKAISNPRLQSGFVATLLGPGLLTPEEMSKSSFKYDLDTGNQLMKNAAKFVGDDGLTVPSLPDFKQAITSGLSAKGTVQGLAGMITIPIEVLTQTKNANGEPVPNTPAEQALGVQKLAGMAAQAVVAGKMISVLGPSVTGEASLTASRMGVLGKSIAANIPAQAAGGFAQGMVSNMGQDDQVSKAIGDALAFAPLGVLFGTLHGVGLGNKITAEKTKFVTQTAPAAVEKLVNDAAQLAAVKELQFTPQDAVADAISKIDAVAKNDAPIHALVSHKLDIGQGAIIQDLTPEQITTLENGLKPSTRLNEGVYNPGTVIGKKLVDMENGQNRLDPLKVVPKFKDTFDKAVWFAGSEGMSAGLIMKDLIDKTGLTKDEILSHRTALKDLVKSSPLVPGQGVIEVPKQNFGGQTGRTPYNYHTYQSGNTTLVTPWKLNPATEEFFTRTGFTPGEVVYDGGIAHAIVDQTAGKETLTKASIRLKSDPTKIFEAPLEEGHGGINKQVSGLDYNDFEHGFTTSKNRFVDRDQARIIARDRGLLMYEKTGERMKGIGSEDIELADQPKLNEVRLQNLTTRKYWSADPASLTRSNENLTSEMWKDKNGNQIGKAGVINRENYFNNLYDKFKEKFVLTEVPNEAYTESISKFAKESGIENKGDIAQLQKSFYSKIQQDVLDGMEESPDIKRVSKQLSDWNDKFNKDFSSDFARSSVGNGMYVVAKGKGVYEIKSLTDGSSIQEVRSPNEALEFIKKSGKTNASDLDGGDTGGVPPTATNLGSLADPFFNEPEKPFFGKKALVEWWDSRVNTGGLSKYTVPADKMFASMDKTSGADFTTQFNALQRVQGRLKWVASNTLKPIETNYNKAVELIKDVPKDRLSLIADNVEFKNADRIAHADEFGLTGKEKQLVPVLEKLFNDIGSTFKFTPDALKEIADATKSPLRNPLSNARTMIYIGSRDMKLVPDVEAYPKLYNPNRQSTLLSFNDVIKQAEEYNAKLLKDIKAGDSDVPYAHAAQFAEHIADVKGIPDLSKQLGDAAQAYLENLYGKSSLTGGDGLKAASLISHTALLGGRFALTLRDIWNAHQIAFNHYGPKFALKVMGIDVPKEYAEDIFKRGVIPNQTGLELLMPGETISVGMDRLSKIANTTMKYNGNMLAHKQMTVGIYKATMDHVAELSGEMIRNETTKAKAYKELKIQSLDDTNQKLFNDYISAGNTVGAAELLARYRVKQIVNIFGSNNNPVAWNTAWGRLAGGMMSWGVNQVQSVADGLLRGSRADRLAYGLRLAGTNTAIATAGYAAGFSVNNWMVNPFSLVGTSPILSTIEAGRQAVNNLTSGNIGARNQSENYMASVFPHNDRTLAHIWLPYSYMVQDYVSAARMAQTDYGPAAVAGQAVGVKPIDTRSSLQQASGNYPYIVDKTGRRRQLPNDNITANEKEVFKP